MIGKKGDNGATRTPNLQSSPSGGPKKSQDTFQNVVQKSPEASYTLKCASYGATVSRSEIYDGRRQSQSAAASAKKAPSTAIWMYFQEKKHCSKKVWHLCGPLGPPILLHVQLDADLR